MIKFQIWIKCSYVQAVEAGWQAVAAELEATQRRLRQADADSMAAAAARNATAQLLQQQEAAADALQVILRIPHMQLCCMISISSL